MKNIRSLIKLIIPGFLVAATGVGAGDLITASLAGKNLGYTILWVPLVGALFKYVLTLGIAKYQLANDESLVQGWSKKLPKLIFYFFILYLLIWSFVVGEALINGAGAALNSIFYIENGKIIFGVIQSLFGICVAMLGSFIIFEWVMTVLVFIMFVSVILISFFYITDFETFSLGFIPQVETLTDPWLVSVLGGVGGTLTILSYGYWLKQSGRFGEKGIEESMIDLKVSYFLTALFSISMIVLGTTLIEFSGGKGNLINSLADVISFKFGTVGVLIFKVGFWAGVFSSLLGVWQSVPFIFADTIKSFLIVSKISEKKAYNVYLLYLGLIPIVSLWINFESIQKLYGVIGALFIPFCAVTLFFMNSDGETQVLRNSKFEKIILVASILFFIFIGLKKVF